MRRFWTVLALLVFSAVLVISPTGWAQVEKARITVEKMVCAACIPKVESALKGLDFVKDAKANLKTKDAEITPQEGKKVELARLRGVIKDAGYVAAQAEICVTGKLISSEGRSALEVGKTGQIFTLLENFRLEKLEGLLAKEKVKGRKVTVEGTWTTYKGRDFILISGYKII